MIHVLHREQVIPASLERVWAYFSNPNNLNAIAPPDMKFEIVSGGSSTMREGQIIEYRVQFVRCVRSVWLTEIAHVREGEYFVDEQRIGPYRFWYHEHCFEPVAAGVKMTDHVTYSVPYGILGDALTRLWIRGRLESIFEYRRAKINELFGSGI